MATDPYPAIRKQVEALEAAAHEHRNNRMLAWLDGDDGPESSPTLDAARAALNRRVEEVVAAAVHRGYIVGADLPDDYDPDEEDRIVASELLNEEPDDAGTT